METPLEKWINACQLRYSLNEENVFLESQFFPFRVNPFFGKTSDKEKAKISHESCLSLKKKADNQSPASLKFRIKRERERDAGRKTSSRVKVPSPLPLCVRVPLGPQIRGNPGFSAYVWSGGLPLVFRLVHLSVDHLGSKWVE